MNERLNPEGMINYALILVLLLLLSDCKPNDNLPQATTSGSSGSSSMAGNGVTLTPTGWQFYAVPTSNQSNPNNYHQSFASSSATTSPPGGTAVVGTSSRSSSYTLGMSASAIADTASFCYWVYSLNPPTSLSLGKTLTLKANLQLTNVQGPGVSLVLRGDKGPKISVLLASTQNKTPIRGTAEPTAYSVTLPYSQTVDILNLYVILLNKTTGTVSVTDLVVSIT